MWKTPMRWKLARTRERDRAAGRTLTGPHRSDFLLTHGPKNMPGRMCSTGEQKGAACRSRARPCRTFGGAPPRAAPILLLDEIAAHLDEIPARRLFDELLLLGTQAWMTGTDRSAFAGLENKAVSFRSMMVS